MKIVIKIILGAVLLSAGGWLFFELNTRNWNSNSSSTSAAREPMALAKTCEGKEYCITVFIAPWCGACRQTEPTFHAFHTHLSSVKPNAGFALVIGAGSPDENAAKKIELTPIESRLDDTGQLMTSQKVNSFPTWVITDKDGKELHRLSGGFRATSPEQVQMALKQYLKL